MNKRKVVLVGTISIITILIVGAINFSNNTNPSTNPQAIASAKISDFSVEWTPFPTVVGVTSISTFNITVENNGTDGLAGLIVTIERIDNDNKTNPDSYSYPNSSDYNFSLSIGQSKVIKVYIIADRLEQQSIRIQIKTF